MNGTLDVIAEPRPEGGWLVRAPRVGIYRGAPRAGGRRMPGEVVGSLTVLGRARNLVLPAGVEGVVTSIQARDRAAPVIYGEPLFALAPAAEAAMTTEAAPVRAAGSLPEGSFAVVSPIDGVFYRSPSPGAPPYVEAGARVETGRTLGLIEAMKSFNAVTYGGPGLPPRAVIEEIRAGDAAEVRQGALLFVVRLPRPGEENHEN